MKHAAVVAHIAVPLLGFSTGMRSFTPLAVAAWFARLGRLPVQGTWAEWLGHPASLGLLTAGALGEYVGDKLPSTPNRTAPLPLTGRILFGGLLGAVLATAFRRPLAGAIVMGAVGALAGSFGGFYARRGLTEGVGLNKLSVAIAGDAAAIGLGVASLAKMTE